MNFLLQLKLQQSGSADESENATKSQARSDEAFEAYEFMHAFTKYAVMPVVCIYTIDK